MALENPKTCLVLHNVQAMREQALAIGLPSLQTQYLDKLDTQFPNTRFICTDWSIAGLLCSQKDTPLYQCMMALQNESPALLTDLHAPEAMPIKENFLATRGLSQPIGQWAHAFRDPTGQAHDLLDVCVETGSRSHFSFLSKFFSEVCVEAPNVKAGFLARHAIGAYDSAAQKLQEIKSQSLSHPSEAAFTGPSSEAGQILRVALMNGVSIPPHAWAGPDLRQSQRTFASHGGPLHELVHALIGDFHHAMHAPQDDEHVAHALTRMKQEGHDIVTLHRDHAEQNQQERRSDLPLHNCVVAGYTECVAVLLNAGADPLARIYSDAYTGFQKGATALELAQSFDRPHMEGMLHASQARQVASNTLRALGLQSFSIPACF